MPRLSRAVVHRGALEAPVGDDTDVAAFQELARRGEPIRPAARFQDEGYRFAHTLCPRCVRRASRRKQARSDLPATPTGWECQHDWRAPTRSRRLPPRVGLLPLRRGASGAEPMIPPPARPVCSRPRGRPGRGARRRPVEARTAAGPSCAWRERRARHPLIDRVRPAEEGSWPSRHLQRSDWGTGRRSGSDARGRSSVAARAGRPDRGLARRVTAPPELAQRGGRLGGMAGLAGARAAGVDRARGAGASRRRRRHRGGARGRPADGRRPGAPDISGRRPWMPRSSAARDPPAWPPTVVDRTPAAAGGPARCAGRLDVAIGLVSESRAALAWVWSHGRRLHHPAEVTALVLRGDLAPPTPAARVLGAELTASARRA